MSELKKWVILKMEDVDGQSPAGPGSQSTPPNGIDLTVGVVAMTLDEEKSAPPQVGFQFVGGGDDAARLGTDYDVLSPALQDCWPVVFDNLSDPKSWSAVSNTCIFFHYLMKSRMAEL
ncbi:Uridylate kinase, partial [Orchesella cincta]